MPRIPNTEQDYRLETHIISMKISEYRRDLYDFTLMPTLV